MKIFSRGMLTDWLLEMLKEKTANSGVLIGDHVAPPEGGWPSGEPGTGAFVAYAILSTGPARSAPGARGNIATTESWDWQCAYTLASYGGLRSQADWAADQVRSAWDDTREQKILLGEDSYWKAQQFSIGTMGPVNRNDQVQPPFYEVIDTASLNLTWSRA